MLERLGFKTVRGASASYGSSRDVGRPRLVRFRFVVHDLSLAFSKIQRRFARGKGVASNIAQTRALFLSTRALFLSINSLS